MKIKSSLRKKVTFIILGITTTMILLFGLYLIVNFKQRLLHQFQEDKKNIGKIVLSNVVPGMEFNQKDDIQKLFKSLEKDNTFVFAAIYDNSGKIYFKHKKSGFTIKVPSKQNSSIFNNKFYQVKYPIISEIQGNLGELLIVFSKKHIIKEVNKILLGLFIFLFILAFVIVTILYLMIQRIVLKPVNELVGFTKNIASGDLTGKVSIKSSDELGKLAENFNFMSESLAKNFSKLKERKNEILQLQLLLNNIIENSPNGLITLNKENEIIKVNPSARKELKWKEEKMEGKIIYKADPNFIKLRSRIKRALKEKETIRANEQYFELGKDEKIFDILIYPISYEKGAGIVILLINMTDRYTLEKQLVQSQKMEAIGTLAGGIAHDFNNILTIILGYLSMLKVNVSGEKNKRRITQIEEASKRATELIKQILVFSRREAGTFKDIDLIDILNNALNFSKELFPRSIKIEKQIEEDSFPVYGDNNLLVQVIINLMINSRDAINESKNKEEGKIFLSMKKVFVNTSIQKNFDKISTGDYIEIKISDNGCGISEEDLDKIFNPFYSTKPKEQGTGLGLSVVYGIIKNHSGTIKVFSKKGEGTTFVILLPLKKSETSDDKEKREKLFKGDGRIVLIDDEEQILNTTKDILEFLGYSVKCFKNGFDAIEYFKYNYDDIDLIILDIIMPGISGVRTFEEMKKIRKKLPPVIFCSGFIEEKLKEELNKKYKNIYFLLKPFNMEVLSKDIYNILKKDKEH